jgi:hypothetical protein
VAISPSVLERGEEDQHEREDEACVLTTDEAQCARPRKRCRTRACSRERSGSCYGLLVRDLRETATAAADLGENSLPEEPPIPSVGAASGVPLGLLRMADMNHND